MKRISIPLLRVDFNEVIELPDLVLLSKTDNAIDNNGKLIQLFEGMQIFVFMEDIDEHGKRDDLYAAGTAEKNSTPGWGGHVKWCCRIDLNGVRSQSDIELLSPEFALLVNSKL